MDATSAVREYGAFGKKINRSVKGLRIGIPKEYFGDGVEPEIKTAVMESVDKLAKEGAQTVSTKDYTNLIDMYEKTRSEGFGDEVKRRIMLGTFVLSSGFYDAYYKRAKQMQQKIAQEYAQAFSQCDVILTPTAPTTAFQIGERTDDPLKMYAADICTVTVNIAGLPAISVPCGIAANGLPIGLQMIGPKFSEQMLFDTAGCFESLCGGFGVAPSVKA